VAQRDRSEVELIHSPSVTKCLGAHYSGIT
jgi:hypothetical protein